MEWLCLGSAPLDLHRERDATVFLQSLRSLSIQAFEFKWTPPVSRSQTFYFWCRLLSHCVIYSQYLTWDCKFFQILKPRAPTCIPMSKRESLGRQGSSWVHWVLEQRWQNVTLTWDIKSSSKVNDKHMKQKFFEISNNHANISNKCWPC